MNKFDIPVVLVIFRRLKAVDVISRIASVQPAKLYLLGDNGRNEAEKKEVEECRRQVEAAINWDCEVIKNYAEENRGVFENIGMGAKWIFEREEMAIFLEDDNLPETTFFEYCRETLMRYKKDTRVLWVCGTNYLGQSKAEDGASYVFTQHMLPCGWASWSDKFNKFYDTELELCENELILSRIQKKYCSKQLFLQFKRCWQSERRRIKKGVPPISWDYHMDFSIKSNNLYGIAPCSNQIKNIGVDDCSTHGGRTLNDKLVARMCGMRSFPMQFPMNHPKTILIDEHFEKEIAKIILYPIEQRIKFYFLRKLRKLLKIENSTISTKEYLKNRARRKKLN